MEQSDLKVSVEGKRVTIAKAPDAGMWVTYEKAPSSPDLILTSTWLEPTTTSPSASKFRAQAFDAALAKARELGWIV
jgi:hypothetical protein